MSHLTLNRSQLMACLRAFDDPKSHRIAENGEEQITLTENEETGEVHLSDVTRDTYWWYGQTIGRAYNEYDSRLAALLSGPDEMMGN